ncbi:DUF2244 domain-containing protein [Mesorhizobium sp. BR1-1-16]|uniref:DUF2244 domain-containing protein n=1 Tax=Mesorhizobium sp. BR1-1-16 TaxID=2876653 RepID=UPI001CCBC8B1|nr:DUF2244 domain-containing protein [Mesorhizobium sp. BR1-1-16]MBZ9935827.1 DUF2244 domain-containing protein [Mesorhizobium sp. BR1-1-16]
MSDRNSDHPAEIVFEAELKPYRSLSPRGFALLLMFVAGTCFASGLLFWSLGAWPIAGFFGLDILAIQFAFRLNYRSARAREFVEVTRDRIEIRRVAASGKTEVFDFNPYWARFEVERVPDWGITRMMLASHGRRLAIGNFLNPDDREGFATAFQEALARVRGS